MDPFCAAATVLQVAQMAAVTAMKVHDTFSIIQNAPQEINAIINDIWTFHTLVKSLEGSLSSTTVFDLVNEDPEIRDAILTLESPIENCISSLNRMMEKMQPYLETDTRSSSKADGAGAPPVRNIRITSNGLLYLFRRKEIFALSMELERTKSTFSNAMGGVNLYVCS